jgi:hypothetical protein
MEEKRLFECFFDAWKTSFTYKGCVSRKYFSSFVIGDLLLLSGVANMLFFLD